MGRPLKIAKAQAILTITATDATTEEVTVSQTLASLGVIAGMPFVVASNVGNLVAGTTYWILQVTGANTFTVSATQLSANPTYTKFDLAGTVGQSVSASVGVVDFGFNNPAGITNTYGVVGGNTSIYGSQVLARVAIGQTGTGTVTSLTTSNVLTGSGTAFNTQLAVGSVVATADNVVLGFVGSIANATSLTMTGNASANSTGANYVFATNEAGFIVRQKGKQKYLVKGATTGLVAQCQTANLANAALTPNTMNILATYVDASTKYVGSLNDYQSEVFPSTFAASVLNQGSEYTIYYSGNTDWTAVGAASNMTGVTFTATGAGSGNGTAILSNANPDVIGTFNSAQAANVDNGQPNQIVSINKA